MTRRPTLLESCAWAATASQAKHRIDRPNSLPRSSRVVALDDGATDLLTAIADRPWFGARFLTGLVEDVPDKDVAGEFNLRFLDGRQTPLTDQVNGADVVIMIATSDAGADVASIIGEACARHRVMAAGLAIGGDTAVHEAVRALRPFAAVLVVSPDDDYVADMLTAIRA